MQHVQCCVDAELDFPFYWDVAAVNCKRYRDGLRQGQDADILAESIEWLDSSIHLVGAAVTSVRC